MILRRKVRQQSNWLHVNVRLIKAIAVLLKKSEMPSQIFDRPRFGPELNKLAHSLGQVN